MIRIFNTIARAAAITSDHRVENDGAVRFTNWSSGTLAVCGQKVCIVE